MQHFLDYYEREYIKKESYSKDIQERFAAHFEEKFLDYQIMEDGGVFFDFSVFDPPFEIKNS